MIIRFVLWAAGLIIGTLLLVTGYGVLTGALEWEKYLSLWAGIAGTVLGYIAKTIEAKAAS